MSDKISPDVELHLEKTRKEDRTLYEGLFSGKWVEKAFIWMLYLVGGMIVAAIVISAAPFIK